MSHTKPSIAVYKFSSCDGCQLSILNMEDELLALGRRYKQLYDKQYGLEHDRFINPGEDFTPELLAEDVELPSVAPRRATSL